MRLSPTLTCRAKGKYFILFRNVDFSLDAKIEASVYVGERRMNSLELVELPSSKDMAVNAQKDFVLIVPELHTQQRVEIDEVDSAGRRCPRGHFKISPLLYKWKSRLNYRFRNALAMRIRCVDERLPSAYGMLQAEEIIPDGNEGIFRLSIAISPAHAERYTLKCFNGNYESVEADSMLVLERDCDSRSRKLPSSLCAVYSIRLPLAGFYVFQLFSSNNVPVSGFVVVDEGVRNDLLNNAAHIFTNPENDSAYHEWFLRQRATAEICRFQQDCVFEIMPKISIVVPLYRTEPSLFAEMVDSVSRQTYANWELVLVNASPEDKRLANLVEEATNKDERIMCVELSGNLGISLNTLEGVRRATGDFVAFLDHDDLLEPDILFHYVHAINANPEIDVLYCDEDMLRPDGIFHTAYLKRDFSIDLLRSQNYICHMLTIRKAVLDQIDDYSPRYDGAQDFNMMLRASELARYIHHVTRVLYHWRMSETSTASNLGNKPQATMAGIRALNAHLERLGIDGSVEQGPIPTTYRITYKVKGEPLVSIVIPLISNSANTRKCVESILGKSTYGNLELVMVGDANFRDELLALCDAISKRNISIKFITWEGDLLASEMINNGVDCSCGEYFVLLNPDVRIDAESWVEEMLGYCQRPDVGAVGSKVYFPDGTIQHAGVAMTSTGVRYPNRGLPLSNNGYMQTASLAQNVSAVGGNCIMSKRSLFDGAEGFDTSLSMEYAAIDYCLKLRESGYSIVYDPYSELRLQGSWPACRTGDIISNRTLFQQDNIMRERWADYYYSGDPFVNPLFGQKIGTADADAMDYRVFQDK